MKDIKDQVCERADDLISFLYGELGEEDARKFEQHLHECARCETEFGSFRQTRDSIISWRDESLGAAWSPGAMNDGSLAPKAVQPRSHLRPSALAAIREFFNLSPMWMKGAAAFASLLFCVCAVLAISYLKDRQPKLVQNPKGTIYSQQDVDKLVAQRVQAQVDEMRKQQQTRPVTESAVAGPSPKKVTNRSVPGSSSGYAVNTRNLRRPLTRLERQELAADLGLLASRDEDGLDLVTDRINQAP